MAIYRLLRDIPISAKHCAVKGAVFKLLRTERPESRRFGTRYFFMGIDGTEFATFKDEIKLVTNDE